MNGEAPMPAPICTDRARGGRRNRHHTATWQAARAARAERRAQDPAVQDRRRQHEAATAAEARRVHLSTFAAAWPKRGAA